MSDTKHTPEMHEDANAVFDCLKYHASAGGEYEYRGTLAIEAFTRMCNEIAALRAQVEEWELIKKAFLEEYNLRNKVWTRNIWDYHSHSHDVSGVWDSDNGSLAGKKCAACMAMRAALAANGTDGA